jgi:predicted nuclease of predicted toxin-antitoxin system
LAAAIRLYLDENIQIVIADQLRRKGIEVVTVRDLALLGDSDANHLRRATAMGCVLCTYDDDYLQLAASGLDHAGIVFGKPTKHTIGDWVNGLELLHAVYSADDMKNHVEYL